MALSIFLAKLLGLYFLLIATDLLLRKNELKQAVKDFASSKGLLVLSGSNSLLFGLAIVISHPIYEINWQGFITILGYLLILRGIYRVAFPSTFQKMLVSFFHREYWSLFLVLCTLGIYLAYSGATAALEQQTQKNNTFSTIIFPSPPSSFPKSAAFQPAG